MVAFALLGFTTSRAQPLPAAPLSQCAEIRALSRDQADRGIPVHVRGVITLLPPWTNSFVFTVDDGTGIWVSLPQRSLPADFVSRVTVGTLVEVRGHTRSGHFAPIILAHQVEIRGSGPLSQPRKILLPAIDAGAHDSQRVEIEGVVQSAEGAWRDGGQVLRLKVATPAGQFVYELIGGMADPGRNYVDAEVSLTGVSLSFFNSRRQFLGLRMMSNDPGDVRVIRPAGGDAFAAPVVAFDEIGTFSPHRADPHRRRVRGTVTLSKPGGYFFLQDGDHALRVNTHQTDPLRPGDEVEAVGFLQLQHHKAEMHDAVFRRVGPGAPPAPVEITRGQAFTQEPRVMSSARQDFDDTLIALRGRLVSFDLRQGKLLRLNLECDGVLVPAEFTADRDAAAITSLRPDSELRISGVCELTFSDSHPVLEWPKPIALRLLLRGPEDVEVLRAASWWTPERLRLALGFAALVLAVSLSWVMLLRRTVAQRGAQLAEEMRARRDAAVEFESTLRERNRLAADLHDTTEQSLTGLALQLEASEALQATAPGRSRQHMTLARQLLDRSREDLRRSIWNLRARPLEKNSLSEALREIAADRSAGRAVRIMVEVEGEQRPLPDLVAGNLLLLAQEGITNALKHGQPKRVALRLVFSDRAVTLIMHDDGAGFSPATAAGPQEGHFGLQGMRERLKRLGGTFEITSAPGQGTTLTAAVPV